MASPWPVGERIEGKDLQRLRMDAPALAGGQEQVETLAYTTHNDWGGESQGVLLLRIRNGAGAEGKQLMASLAAEHKQQVVERGIRIAGRRRGDR